MRASEALWLGRARAILVRVRSAAVTALSSAESTGRYKSILRLTESESGPEPVAGFARASRSACRGNARRRLAR